MKSRWFAVALRSALLGIMLTGSACAGWWDDRWEARLPITVEQRPGVLATRPVVVGWGDVAGELSGAKARLSSLRLVDSANRIVPFQVDHCDGNGDFLPPGDLELDPQDELVFVCPTDQQTMLHLYFSAEPRPPAEFPGGVEVYTPRFARGWAHHILSTAGMKVTVQGEGMLDQSTNHWTSYHRGTVASLSWRGTRLTSNVNWSIAMNRSPFGGPWDNTSRWQRVKLVVNGPVRKVVAMQKDDYRSKDKDGNVIMQAHVTRYFSMFAGVPLYDVEDVARCSVVPPDWSATYTDKFLPGGKRDEDDVLWDGSSGEPRTFPLAERKGEKNGHLVTTDSVVDGWYAWIDQKKKAGLAIFYEPAKALGIPADVAFESGWEMWSNSNQMKFTYEGLKAPTTFRNHFRVIGIEAVTPQQVVHEYGLWQGQSACLVTVGPVERK